MLYRYKTEGPPATAIQPAKDKAQEEPEVYYIQGKKASKNEYWIATALKAHDRSFRFRVRINTPWQIPGQENEIDFIIDERYLLEFDGEYAHKTANQRAKDAARDQLLGEWLRKFGYLPIKRVSHLEIFDLASANRFVTEEL